MASNTSKKMVIAPRPAGSHEDEPITMSARIFLDFLQQAKTVHARGLKSYGVFTAEADGSAFHPTGVTFFDPTRNRRNSLPHRAAFQAQGTYFRAHDDAGFVVDSQEMVIIDRAISQTGQTIVALFHSHRRQPPNFSSIDYRLHNPLFSWHLVVCLRDPARPEIQPFLVEKDFDFDDFGIDATDNREGCENSYLGDNVRPLELLVEGTETELDQVVAALGWV